MKKTLTLIAAALLATTSAFAADPITPAQAKALVKTKISAKVAERLRGITGVAIDKECQVDFAKAVAKAEASERRCNNADNPPAGSPVAKFNALNNVQLASFCGNKTLEACVDGVIAEQAAFCDAQSKPDIDAATALRDKCVKFVKACDDSKKELAKANADIAKLEQQLAAEKAKAAELTRKSAALCRIAERLKD